MVMGKCTKCNKSGNMVMHHTKGYNGVHKDEVYPYCKSCHMKIHIEARKSGKCKIPVKELKKLSNNSFSRRYNKNRKSIEFSESITPNIALCENIYI